jgi:diguanylate cyclase (GGDEF)-like protein
MQFVQQTLLLITAIVGLVFALGWLLMAGLLQATPRACKLFMVGNLALVAGVVLVGLRTPQSGFWYHHGADWILIAGFGFLHRGLLHLIDVDRPPALHSALPWLMAVVVTAPFAPSPDSYTVLSLALYGTSAWYVLTAYMDGMRGLDAEVFSKIARAGVSAPFLCMGLVLIVGTLDVLRTAIFASPPPNASDATVMLLWAMVLFLLLANITLATLATGRLLMRIRALAEMDYLTGCLNRRSLEQRMKIELDRHLRSSEPMACVFFDLDHFKRINDDYGHEAGDAALKHTVQLIGGMLRSMDALGRYGGEEFMVLMPNTDLKGVTDAAQRMRIALTRSKLEFAGQSIALTASFGAAALGDKESLDSLVRRADAAMYDAKRLGRNRVEIHTGV